MIRRPPRSTLDRSSAASDVYKRQPLILDKNLSINPKQIESSLKKNTLLCAPMNVLHPNPQGLQYFEELGTQRFLTKSMTFQETLKTEKYNWEKTCQNEIIKILCGKENGLLSVSYTHLTLPKSDLVEISENAVI